MALTPTIRLTAPTVGGDVGLWAGELNNDLTYIDEATNGLIGITIPDANVVLTADGTSADQARYAVYNITGALTANRTVTLPACQKLGWAIDNTTGGHTVTLANAGGGATLSLGKGLWTYFWTTTANVSTLPVAFASVSATIGNFSASISTTTGNFSGQVTANTFAAGGALVFGTTSGWVYNTSGPSAFPSQSISYGVIASASTMIAQGYYAVSDVRLKLDIADIPEAEAVGWVQSSRPVTYRKLLKYGDDPETAVCEAGFIAQDQVRAGFGRYVGSIPAEGMPERVDADGFISKADHMLNLPQTYQIAYLTRALQAALARIAALESGFVRQP